MSDRLKMEEVQKGDGRAGNMKADAAIYDVVSEHGLGLTDSEKQVYRAVRSAIVEHRLPPGTKLPEEELAGIYDISRMRVRRVLLSLSHARIVTLFAGRGAFVAKPTPAEAREVFEARRTIETAVLADMDRPASPALIAKLRRNVSAGRAAIRRGDRTQAIRLSGAFHIHITTDIGNKVLAGFMEELVARSSLVLTLYMPGHAPVCHDDHHAEILKVLGESGFRRAAPLMRRHLIEIEANLNFDDRTERVVDLRDILMAAEAKPSAGSRIPSIF